MHIAYRDDRSAASFLLHNLFLRPWASRLRKIKQSDHDGSPRLHAPLTTRRKCNVTERQVEGIWLYDVVNKKIGESVPDPSRKRTRVYFFAGGSWQNPPDDAHWKFLTSLSEQLKPSTIFTVVSPPLAPKHPAAVTFPRLVDLYHALMHDASFAEEDVCFAGDSSGGNIALALTMYCIASKDRPCRNAPHSLLLISPTVDLVHNDPKLPEASKHDPIESLEFVRETAAAWAGDMDLTDPRLSPGLGVVKDLADWNIHVYGIIAGYDVLGVEAKTFAEKCKEVGVKGRFLVWEKQMHNFPLTAPYKVPEGVKGLDWIAYAIEHGGRNFNDDTNEGFERIENTDSTAFKDWSSRKVDHAKDALKNEWTNYHPHP